MKHMPVFRVLLLTLVTVGIYPLVWLVRAKTRMNQLGAAIPSAWFMVIPLVNIWWTYKFSEGVEHTAREHMSKTTAFLILLILGAFGILFIQHAFNKMHPAAG